MIHNFFLILFIVLLSLNSSAQVLEFKTFDELLISLLSQIETLKYQDTQHLKKLSTSRLKERLFAALEKESQKSVFLTDLDRTLIQTENYIGRVEWFWEYHAPRHRAEILQQFPKISKGALEKRVDQEFWKFTLERPQVTLVDHEYSQLLLELQQRGHIVMGLTARGTELIPMTLQQLHDLGLQLGKNSAPFLEQVNSRLQLPTAGTAVVFAEMKDSGSTKGEVLAVLHEAAVEYARIVFFDDRDREIQSALQARERHKISPKKLVIAKSRLSELRRRKDPHHRRFYSVALIQEEALQKEGRWISNQEAMNRLINTQGLKLYRCVDLFHITD